MNGPDGTEAEQYARLGVDEHDPHWGLICHHSPDGGVGFMGVYCDPSTGNETLSCQNCGAWVEHDAEGNVVARSLALDDQLGVDL